MSFHDKSSFLSWLGIAHFHRCTVQLFKRKRHVIILSSFNTLQPLSNANSVLKFLNCIQRPYPDSLQFRVSKVSCCIWEKHRLLIFIFYNYFQDVDDRDSPQLPFLISENYAITMIVLKKDWFPVIFSMVWNSKFSYTGYQPRLESLISPVLLPIDGVKKR